jgi:hypothetical protein
LTAEERRAAEDEIADDPLGWPVIRGTGGARKARAARGSSGKSGGMRIIYYPWQERDTILLLLIYAKNEQEDITQAQKQAVRKALQTLTASGGNHGEENQKHAWRRIGGGGQRSRGLRPR